MANRYFVTSSTGFTFAAVPNLEAKSVTAQIYVGGVLRAIVGLNSGISEIESPPGTFTYHIVDKELTVTGSCSIRWYAQDASDVNADTYPVVTSPTITTVASTAAITVDSSTPTAGATSVSTRDALILTFSDDIDTSIINASQIVLRIPGTTVIVPTTVYVDTDDTTRVIVKPQSTLAESTLFELLVKTDALYSTAGAQLAADFTLRFTTGADSFSTVVEATTEGVVERAGPIILANSTSATTASATLSGSTPAAGSYTFSGDTITLRFSEDLLTSVVPTITIDVQPLFGLNEYYTVGGSLWSSTEEPTIPTVQSTSIVGNELTITLSDDLPGNGLVTITVADLETDAAVAIPTVTLEFTSEVYPLRVGVTEVRNLIRKFIASDVTNELIAQMIANVGINLLAIYGDNAIALQRCVIAHEVAMQLLDDWLVASGGITRESKTLGAFSVSKGPATVAGGTYARMQKELDECRRKLDAYFNRITSTIKSICSPLERKDYRIRTWREAHPTEISFDENHEWDRKDKMPDQSEDWS